VWQHHDLFHKTGIGIAQRHGCPLVSYVHAPQVWEAQRWGVRRPGWAHALERLGERPQLLASDVVACVSDEAAHAAHERLGVPADRLIVSPMAVDTDRFNPSVSGHDVRVRLELDDSFVVGWIGTFRRFHALEYLVDAFVRLHAHDDRARLLLVGRGSTQDDIEAFVRARGVTDAVRFAGAIHHLEMPSYIAAMDVAVVSALPDSTFHYSPQKLREYLACARPVVAPRVGEVPRSVQDGVQALLHAPGDPDDLAGKISHLADDPAFAKQLGVEGRRHIVQTATWQVRLEELLSSRPFVAAAQRLRMPTG
jgi:glycosyltransferase involved in cell wall biosynthesis